MADITNIEQTKAELLKKAFENNQLAHSYLFVDKDNLRAVNTAYWLACLFNCTGENKPDGTCSNCRQILSGNFPDVLFVDTDGKQTIGIDQIRPLKEELAKSPVLSSRRFFIINDAQKLTMPAANALLNLLEEPVAPVVSILITNNQDQILPTIRSRTQILNFETDNHPSNNFLLDNGFSDEEIAQLGDTKQLNQMIKYFYQEMLESNDLSLVSAHKLAELGKTQASQRYILLRLKQLAQVALEKDEKRLMATRMLKCLIEVDKMQLSNVNFKNCLDYLALQWER